MCMFRDLFLRLQIWCVSEILRKIHEKYPWRSLFVLYQKEVYGKTCLEWGMDRFLYINS